MLATASVLASAELNDKVIVLTGAFQPEAFKESDAGL
jgi:L-asparaginase/Glu-tRNA(Gln) amidotransferase subunit D